MERVSDILFSLFRGTPQHGDWVVACLEGAWAPLVGERLAAACRPVSFEGSELVIEITDREWDDAIRSLADELLEKIRDATGNEVQQLSFR